MTRLTLFALVAVSIPSFAMPRGEKEAFMANTGIALKDSAGSVVFNPAGLQSVEKSKISATANSYYFLNSKESGSGGDSFDSSGSIPGLISSVNKYSASAFAYWVNVPFQGTITNNYNSAASDLNAGFTGQAEFTVEASRSTLQLGASYARPIATNWDLGMSLYFQKSDATLKANIFYDEATTTNGFSQDIRITQESTAALAQIGAVRKINRGAGREPWRLGLSLLLPQVNLSGNATFRATGTAFTGAPSTVNQVKKPKADPASPAVLNAGLSLPVTSRATLLADTTYRFDYKSETISTTGAVSNKKYAQEAEAGIGFMLKPVYRNHDFRAGLRYWKNLNPDRTTDLTDHGQMTASFGVHSTIQNIETGIGFYHEIQESKFKASTTSSKAAYTREVKVSALLLSLEYRF